MSGRPWHVGVVIPARNEEKLLPRCLDSVMAACAALPSTVTFDIIVGVDSSTDLTFEIAERMLFGYGEVFTTEVGAVGAVRFLASQIALRRYSGQLSRCWLANTDADCCVPRAWLNDQLAFASQNVEAIAGIIDIDSFREHRQGVDLRFRQTYLIYSDGTHPHVHGANLGVRADTYLRAGGWRHLETAEDHDLWNRLKKTKSNRRSLSAISVLTSGRRVGRAPKGFAETLGVHNEMIAC